MAATSSDDSGFRQSRPVTSPAKFGLSCLIDIAKPASPRDARSRNCTRRGGMARQCGIILVDPCEPKVAGLTGIVAFQVVAENAPLAEGDPPLARGPAQRVRSGFGARAAINPMHPIDGA